jgi:type I restriction enzyme S subunit
MNSLILEHIDKSNWKAFPFEKIAKRVAETVDPNKTDLDIYYGLEHLDPDDIHIRRNGTPDDVSGGKLKCYPGDVIFGKRRAYQRKAGIVSQLAICSAHAFVFRANEEIIDASLFPFFLHSDHFMHRMVDISVGGLSPTVNWSDLKHQEFLLPAKAQQVELAVLLWAMDEMIEKDLVLLEKLERFQSTFLINDLANFNRSGQTISTILSQIEQQWGLISLSEIGSFLKGKGIPKDDVKTHGTPCIRYGEIYTSHHYVIRTFKSFIAEETKATALRLNKGDIIFAGSGETISEIGKSVCFENDFEAYAGGDTVVLRPNNKMYTLFLAYLLNSDIVRLQLNQLGTGATVAHIYPEDLKRIKIPNISLDMQMDLAGRLEDLYHNIFQLKTKLASSRALQRSLINKLF